MVSSPKMLEWRAMWPIAMVAMLGVAGSGLYSMTSSVFMGELTHAFGWSKAQFTSSMTGQIMVNVFTVPLVGRAIDRFGTRAVALTGLLPAVLGMAILGLANGTIWQWWMLCIIQAMTIALVLPPVWITGVVGNFRVSRGLAIAIALAGAGVGAAIWPVLAAFYVEWLGWRLAFGAVALTWGAVMIPVTVSFFHGPKGGPTLREKRTPQPIAHILLSRTFLCLTISGALYICVCYGMILHLVPILRTGGLDLSTAALVAGIAGIFSIVGRLGTGFLLDIVPTRIFGVTVFILPVAVSLLFHYCVWSFPLMLLAVTILGLALGAESDILSYIAARRFEHAVFGSVYAVIQTVFSISAVAGSVLAATLYDIGGSYALFLNVTIPMTIIGAVTLGFVPDQKPLNTKADAGGSALQKLPAI